MRAEEALRMRPTLDPDRHLPAFRQLSREQAIRVYDRLAMQERIRGTPPDTGEALFVLCRQSGLDHASVVLSLSRENDEVGRGAIAALCGREIDVWVPRAPVRPSAGGPPNISLRDGDPRPRPRAPTSKVSVADDLVVIFVGPNPKKPGSSTYERFRLWRVGRTVRQCIEAGLTRADVQWDADRHFVELGTGEQLEEHQRANPELPGVSK